MVVVVVMIADATKLNRQDQFLIVWKKDITHEILYAIKIYYSDRENFDRFAI